VHELGKPRRRDRRIRRLELIEGPPPKLVHVLDAEVERGLRLVLGNSNEEEPLPLVDRPRGPFERVVARPDPRAERHVEQAELLTQLTPHGVLVSLAWGEAAARRRPMDAAGARLDELDEHDAVGVVEDDGACRLAHRRHRSSRSARNQRRRSEYGTAAFAGDVDGRTKRAASPSARG